ncbi:hypothetical protein EGC77_05945 [Shewanella psychromarinicola]|uniref:Uncharacterized protein n=1 Tax=Shewanella psychromarinicola TaxID=2487742 RepID=A0A3N4EG42_9GAMM|nr:hypothetical protein EGC77_05945 [Shewanella psychromarinicola]
MILFLYLTNDWTNIGGVTEKEHSEKRNEKKFRDLFVMAEKYHLECVSSAVVNSNRPDLTLVLSLPK